MIKGTKFDEIEKERERLLRDNEHNIKHYRGVTRTRRVYLTRVFHINFGKSNLLVLEGL
jgi:hypothetical protein